MNLKTFWNNIVLNCFRKFNGNPLCFINNRGQLHRENGPAIILPDGGKEYWVNDKLHREDGPAVDKENVKMWAINGKLHRDKGPAVLRKTGEHMYFTNGDMRPDLKEQYGATFLTIKDEDDDEPHYEAYQFIKWVKWQQRKNLKEK